MKLKKVRIVVEQHEALNNRWLEALKGKVRSPRGVEIISVGSWEVLAKILAAPRLQILTSIPQLKPKSTAHLARLLKRDFKNIHADVRFLADLGLIELVPSGTRGAMMPVAKYSEIELPLVAA
jgi:predicted transcriptional regulator